MVFLVGRDDYLVNRAVGCFADVSIFAEIG
jgi:hypothetical protein